MMAIDSLIHLSKSLVLRPLLLPFLLIFLSGCTLTPNGGPTLDWIDFIHFNGITYLASTTR